MADTTVLTATVAAVQTASDAAIASINTLRSSSDQTAVDSAYATLQTIANSLTAAATPPTPPAA
jgi:hypothetical protein